MKRTKSFFTRFLIFGTIVCSAILFSSCPREPEPVLNKPNGKLKLLEDSPQNSVIITWTPSDDADSYYIERTMEREGQTESRQFEIKAVPLAEATASSYTYIDNTCESGTEYTYVVTVEAYWNDGGLYPVPKSLKSDAVKITTAVDPKVTLAYPKNVKVEPAANKANALTVTWDSVSDALEYEVYYCSSWNSNFNELYKKAGSTSQTTYTMEHLGNTLHYYFMIKAIKGDEYSLFSAKADGRVADAENLSKAKAFILENGVEETFISDSEELWFKCQPQKGLLTIDNDHSITLTILDAEGAILASGIPLFISGYEKTEDPNLVLINDNSSVQRNIKNDISNFVPGNTYYLRIISADRSNYSICVE